MTLTVTIAGMEGDGVESLGALTDPRLRDAYRAEARADGQVVLTFAAPFDDLCLVSGTSISLGTAERLADAVVYFRARHGLPLGISEG